MEGFFVVATWLDVSAISACVGMLVCAVGVVPHHAPGTLKDAVWNGFGWMIALLSAASVVLLASRTLEFSESSFAGLGHFLPLVLTRTQYGLIWSWRMGAVGVLWLCWLAGRYRFRGPAVEAIAAGALLVVVFSRSATGHAGDQGIFAPAVWVDSLHVLAGAMWVGSLFAMSLRIVPWLSSVAGDQRQLILNVFERLSKTAGVALLLVLVTGVLNAWEGLGHIQVLWHSRYGEILLAKLVLVTWMVCIGAHNRYVKIPNLARWADYAPPTDANPLRVSARALNIGSLLGIGVLAAAALLHHAMPPTDLRHSQSETLSFKSAQTACNTVQNRTGEVR